MKGIAGMVSKSIIAGSIGLGSMCVNSQEIAQVRELGPEEVRGKVGVILKIVQGEIHSICNYGKTYISDQEMVVIAKHCVLNMEVSDTYFTEDYIVTPNITQLFQNRGIDIKFISAHTPRARERSEETNQSIVGKQVTINSCIPGAGRALQCWEIKGNAYREPSNPRRNSIKISSEDYRNILKSGDRRGGAVTGMSGNIVLDSNGKVFGVLSTASAYSDLHPYEIVTFEPLRSSYSGGKTRIIPH